jgi:hypothetical protein
MQLRPASGDDGGRSWADLDVSLPRLPASDRQRVRAAGAVAQASGRRQRTVHGVHPRLRRGRGADVPLLPGLRLDGLLDERGLLPRLDRGRRRRVRRSLVPASDRLRLRGDGIRGCLFRPGSGKSTTRTQRSAAPLSRTVVSASDGDDDLATRVAVSEVPDRGRHLFERERPVHNGSDGARFEQPPQLLQVLSALL